MKNFIKFTTFVCVLVFLLATIASAKDWHVPGDCAKIQECLDKAASGDRVWVAAGTYEENITLKSGVELIGVDGADVTKIRKSTGTVVMADAVGFRTKIDGFTIDGVDKAGSSDYGICCVRNSSLTIINVTITNAGNNGIYCGSSSPTVSNVTITNTGSYGIGCYSSSPTVSNVTIANTRDTGIRCESSSPAVSNVTITNAGNSGIYCYSSSPTVSNVTITNTGSYGIGCSSSSPTVSNVTITNAGNSGIYCYSSSPTVSNVTITNTEDNGIYCDSSSPTVSNVTITLSEYDGIYCAGGSKPKIRGSLISQNSLNGIYIDSNSLPDLGTEADPGGNSICFNGSFDVVNKNPIAVKAELNWWGQSPPNPAFFSGKVDYDPWLTEPPPPIVPPPSITSVSPNVGPLTGGTWITITGKRFATGATVTIGVNSATDVTVVSETKITAKTPAGTAGAKDVSVCNPDGQCAILPNGFFYATIPKTGDVSGNGQITAYDAALILQYVVGLIDKFPADEMGSPSISPHPYVVSIPEQSARAGDRIYVPVAIDDATGLLAGGISLKYDRKVLKAIKAFPDMTLNGSYWKANVELEGEVRFAFATTEVCLWFKPQATVGQENLLMVEFEVLPNTKGKTSPLILEDVNLSNSLTTTKVNGSVTVIPSTFALLQNYPNPFNPDTWIPFELANPAEVTIRIYNTKGQLVRALRPGNQNAGAYITKGKAAYWDGKDSSSEKVASGVYFYTLEAGKFRATRKMVIFK